MLMLLIVKSAVLINVKILFSSLVFNKVFNVFWAVTNPAIPAQILEIPTVSHLGKSASYSFGNKQFKQTCFFLLSKRHIWIL